MSPRIFWGWRRWLLRCFGARVGRDTQIYPSVRIAIPWHLEIGEESAVGDYAVLYALGPIRIGSKATISQGAHLCAGTHDINSSDFALLKPPISIGDGTWVCADAFIGPGVTIGTGTIVGARSVVVKDVGDRLVVAGNPARKIREI